MAGAVQLGVPVDDDDVHKFGDAKKDSQTFDLEEQSSLTPPPGMLLRDANAQIRLGFVRKVYGILSAQLILTACIAAPISLAAPAWLQKNSWLLTTSLFMSVVMVCAIACCQKVTRNYPTNYMFLFGFTVFESVIVGFVSASYTWQSVLLCAGLTAAIFLALTAFAFKTKTDFTGMGPYLFAGLLVLVSFGFVLTILLSFGVHIKGAILLYDMVGVLLFVFYIIYDTQLIIGGEHKEHEFSIDDYVFAALNLYLDIIQLFLHLLRMLGDSRDS